MRHYDTSSMGSCALTMHLRELNFSRMYSSSYIYITPVSPPLLLLFLLHSYSCFSSTPTLVSIPLLLCSSPPPVSPIIPVSPSSPTTPVFPLLLLLLLLPSYSCFSFPATSVSHQLLHLYLFPSSCFSSPIYNCFSSPITPVYPPHTRIFPPLLLLFLLPSYSCFSFSPYSCFSSPSTYWQAFILLARITSKAVFIINWWNFLDILSKFENSLSEY